MAAIESGLKRAVTKLRSAENAILLETTDELNPLDHVVFRGYSYILEEANDELETIHKALCGEGTPS